MRSLSHRIPTALSLLAVLLFLVPATATAADTDIVITEIMQNPTAVGDTDGEWFEIHNTGATPVDIEGWTMRDGGIDDHLIASGGPLVVPAGSYAVLARNATAMAGEGVTALYEYSGFFLANGDDEIVLVNTSAVVVDSVAYTGTSPWPDPTGASMMWDESTLDNNDGNNWNEAWPALAFGSGDYGTPGAANPAPGDPIPVIADVMHRSLLPQGGEAVTVSCNITVNGTLPANSAFLHTAIDAVPQSPIAMTAGTFPAWTGTIPAGSNGQVVDYFVVANSLTTADTSATYTYTIAAETITSIASIHADSTGYDGTVVMVQGQVYIPGNYQADGTSVSAYIQDASGRGLNVYGTFVSTGMADLNDTSNIVKVSGTVDWFGDTLEIVRYEVELVSTGNAALTPTVLSTGAAAAFGNIGTYISSTGPITAIASTGGSNPAYNFTIDDTSGPLVIRIDEDLVAGMNTWILGDELVAAGAGTRYGGEGQITVGLASDIVNNGQGPDLTPPTLDGATLTAATEVTLHFSEGIDATTGNDAGNYTVYETATPANTTTVTGAVVQTDSTKVVLTLAASISGVDHTVSVTGVEDLAGNPIAAGSTAAIIEPGEVNIVINEVMRDPVVLSDAVGEWFEVHNAGADPVDMEGWTIKDAGTNEHVIANGAPVIVAPGAYAVFGIDATAMAGEGVTLAYEYSGIALSNNDDEIILLDASLAEIDRVEWDTGLVWPNPSGASIQWNGTGDNNDGANWQAAAVAFGSGDLGTPGAANDLVSAVPEARLTALGGNNPNPFNPQTTFDFSLERDDYVSLQVFDLRGFLVRTVVDARLTAGNYDGVYRWDGRDAHGRAVTSGTYLYRLRTGSGFAETRKMALLK